MKRKLIRAFLTILLLSALTVTAFAAPEAPEITLQPQSPNYPEYSVAIYTVKVSGTNLSATWYMEWLGDTYTISDIGGSIQPWEGYAGESYGARKLDDNTFAYIFEGIEYDLDGAYIWCVIEDGHYDVRSQKTRISVGNPNSPPQILDIPSQVVVEQGEEAEIRCVANAPGNTQLSFLWYETDTGRMEDMRAVNRGTETADFLFCDTSQLGTRYYLCKVDTSEGGLAYSSVVAVTVTEKSASPTQPDAMQPQISETKATESVTQETVPAQESETAATEPVQAVTEETKEKTTEPIPQAEPRETEAPEKSDATDAPKAGLPWWSLVLIALAGIGAGIGVAMILIRKMQK